MGVVRDTEFEQVDIVKEMAESLGSQGIRLEEILETIQAVCADSNEMFLRLQSAEAPGEPPSRDEINELIRNYNTLIGRAHDTLRWLLIQREACGFRKHRDVYVFYPIPPKARLL